MLMKKNIILIFVLTILTISCGYQKISQNYPLVYLQNIKIDGETRLAYIVKNNILLISDQTAKDKYDIEIKIIKKKTNKIKNISGKITRYKLSFSATLMMKNIDTQKIINRNFNINSDYDVAKNYSETIKNEKNASKIAINQLSEEIKKVILFLARN
jgi:ribosome-binding protein aMBF1 (putative translation factor)